MVVYLGSSMIGVDVLTIKKAKQQIGFYGI